MAKKIKVIDQLSYKMKIHSIQTTYLISLPFKYNSKKGIIFHLILQGNVIIHGLSKLELACIRITTTKGDCLYTPKKIRLEVDSRYMSETKLEKTLSKIISEVNILFEKDNIHLANKILKEHINVDLIS